MADWASAADLRLEAIGGVAGDRFIAAACDAAPALQPALEQAFAAFPFPAGAGARFGRVARAGLAAATFSFSVPPAAGPGIHNLADAGALFARARLQPAVTRHALAIYRLLADAEAAVHGTATADVHLHEVGDWDSIADVLGAALVIAAAPAARWSVGPLPLGSGTVRGRHGLLPVPAPATAKLLEGFRWHQDGVPGERVTPTGAAILRYLDAHQAPAVATGPLLATGSGAGSRALPGVPNVLRVLAFGAVEAAVGRDRIAVLRFEIDDQSPEDLATGLDRLRARDDVLDVTVWNAQGKKGRMAFAVQVLAKAESRADVGAACLAETATLGVRWQVVDRQVLPREERVVEEGRQPVGVKRVARPGGGTTRKAAADDVARHGGDYAGRAKLRRRAEDADG